MAVWLVHVLITPHMISEQIAEEGPQMVQKTLAATPPALVFTGVSLRKSSVPVGESLVADYNYSKRAECTPSLGTGRHVFFAYDSEQIFALQPFKSANNEPYGNDKSSSAAIRTTGLPPGNYQLQIISRFSCKGEPSESVAQSDLIPFTIVPST